MLPSYSSSSTHLIVKLIFDLVYIRVVQRLFTLESPTSQKFAHPPPRKIPPVDLSLKKVYSFTPLNKIFHVVTQ